MLVILYGLLGSLVPTLAAPDSLYQLANGTFTAVVFLFVPLSVAIAILRSRLWDIDILVRRTLVYSTLTVILALLYVGLVFALGDVLRSFFGQQQQNPLVIVASTLVIAALFQPLRHGAQRIIDRRFYRRKYDAALLSMAVAAQTRGASLLVGSEASRIILHVVVPIILLLMGTDVLQNQDSDVGRASGHVTLKIVTRSIL